MEAAQNHFRSKGFGNGQSGGVGASDAGCTRILLEGKYLFNAIDAEEDFGKYKVIILPDEVRLDEELQEKFREYMEKGGKVLLSGTSGLWVDKEQGFALDLGIRYLGESTFSPTYVRPAFEVKPFRETAFVMYGRAQRIENLTAQRIAGVENPYFNRTVLTFSSHAHAPNDMQDAGPGITLHPNGAYNAWDIFRDYGENGSLICKKLVCHVLEELLSEGKTVKTDLPAQGITTLTRQNERYVLHFLYASPVKRGTGTEVIEDILPLYDISVEVNVEQPVQTVKLQPQNEELSFVQEKDHVRFTVPKLWNHQMVEIGG